MRIVTEKISLSDVKTMSTKMFGNWMKAVVDIEKEIMVVDADLHADEEALLLEEGSQQENLWGINLYPEKFSDENWVVFDSMINLRPSYGNKSRGVDSLDVQKRIRTVVNKLVVP